MRLGGVDVDAEVFFLAHSLGMKSLAVVGFSTLLNPVFAIQLVI
jgi:hypothetical protein